MRDSSYFRIEAYNVAKQVKKTHTHNVGFENRLVKVTYINSLLEICILVHKANNLKLLLECKEV